MKKYLILIIVATGLVYLLFSPEDDSGEIEAVFVQAIKAGEKKDLDGVMEHFAIDYRDEEGATYPVIKNIIKNFFDKFDRFEGQFWGLKVSIDETEDGEKRAIANLDISVSGINSDSPVSILGSEDSPHNLTVTLKRSGLGSWKITKVQGVEQ
jgi:hypothetical protein